MTGAKFDIEKFDGPGDFGLWRIKMRDLLIQHGCEAALEVLYADMKAQTKVELNKQANSAVILCLGNKVKFEDEDLALLLLTSLQASYEHFVDTLLYGREALTLENVMATLNSKEIKERSKAKGDDGEGLYVRGITDRRDSRHSRGKSRSKSRGERLKCNICQSEDHLKRNCPKNNRSDDGDERTDSARLDHLIIGCFIPMHTRYIPELKRNLISLGTLEKERFTVKLQLGKVKVINGSRVILSGIRRDNCVYSLDGHAMSGELNASVEEKDSLTLGKLDFCENYVLGKSHRVSFSVGRHTTQGVIDYVHSDLWDPSQVESLGGKRYFLSIVDDYSKRVWVYILRFKHKAFGKFKEWKQFVENQTRGTVKKPRTNNGLEFCNHEFEQLCIESGIARHLTVVRTSQQNRVAERMNITLMDKVRCLLIQSGLPKTFLAEATCTAAYLINRSPSGAIEKKKPIEMWSGHPRYPEGVKGYRLYMLDDESPKILKDSGTSDDKSVEELHVEVELQSVEEDTMNTLTCLRAVLVNYSSLLCEKLLWKEEMDSLRKNKTWELVDHPAGQKRMSCKWLFKIKEGIEDVQKPRYKSRLVARGFTQRAVIDYNEVFSPVVRHTSIRVILALTACKDYELEQLDVKTAFLHKNLEEVI
ncbi:retrovirus-related pol polyprotein from transposon TNT 1-94 [Tanacetum coccineum]